MNSFNLISVDIADDPLVTHVPHCTLAYKMFNLQMTCGYTIEILTIKIASKLSGICVIINLIRCINNLFTHPPMAVMSAEIVFCGCIDYWD